MERRSEFDRIRLNQRIKADGLELLRNMYNESTPLVFFDPQYRGVLDKMNYGNEGEREPDRAGLPTMDEYAIEWYWMEEIKRVLKPSGHLMLWIDKFLLVSGTFRNWTRIGMNVVDMITWNKKKMGMGYRTRRVSEHLIIIQKDPKRAKGIWKNHSIPDVFDEPKPKTPHPHGKPINLQCELIRAVTEKGDMVVDPAAGSYSVLEACRITGRDFYGCDLVFNEPTQCPLH